MSRVAIAIVVLGLLASACFAQTATQNVSISVSEVNTIAANGAAAFAITAPLVPGEAPVITPTQSASLAYTSILPSTSGARKINAKITTDVPAGLQLGAVVSGVSGTGTVGTAATGGLLNTSTAVDLVTGIGSCYTTAPTLTYSLGIIPTTGMALVKATAAPATAVVTYTMTAAQ
jgi:hypothetical protein